MICCVFRRGRKFWGKLRLGDVGPVERIPLDTCDRRSAVHKLAAIAQEREKEAAGLLAPRSVRERELEPLPSLLAAFLGELTVKGRSAATIDKYRKTLGKVFVRCRWHHLADVTPSSFCAWRRQSGLEAKTLNDLLASLVTFLRWLVVQGLARENPLQHVQRIDTRGRSKQFRRALTRDELGRLLAVAPPHRRIVYLTAAFTGLRRAELSSLRWSDVELVPGSACIRVRASMSKNRKAAVLPMHDELAAALRAFKPSDAAPFAFVLRGLVPRIPTFRKDLLRAGVPFEDSEGRRVDLHALRVTYGTNLTASGAAPRVVMELMRHSDIALTMKIYTDAAQLPLVDAVAKLPAVGLAEVCPKTCPNVGQNGAQQVAS